VTLEIDLLGELAVRRDGEPVTLPASRKSRALLAYLILKDGPQRRDRLCELFWEIPDDPRGALRWSLSKLRGVVNDAEFERLVADRERVSFDAGHASIDLTCVETALRDPDLSVEELQKISRKLAQPFLDGIDMPNNAAFQRWLNTERMEIERLAAGVAARLSKQESLPLEERLASAMSWSELSPFDTDAAASWLALLHRLGRDADRHRVARELTERFTRAGIEWPPATASQSSDKVAEPTRRQLKQRQTIQFCEAEDGVRIAYASVGDGPPIVKAANWLTHLELDWDAPIWSPLFRQLAKRRRFIRYDERGNGLSDWDVSDLSLDAFVRDLETVVDSLELEQFPLLGISQGAAVSIKYAVRHPQRVSHLILFGAYAAGWRIDASESTLREREAIITLTESGWGQDNPAYRQIFSSTFMPSATTEELSWFNEFQRRTTSPENAARFLSAFGDIDVRHLLSQVQAPTLVIHSQGDCRIPAETGRDIAASIPNAEYLSLDSDGHLLLGREPASASFVDAVTEFLDR